MFAKKIYTFIFFYELQRIKNLNLTIRVYCPQSDTTLHHHQRGLMFWDGGGQHKEVSADISSLMLSALLTGVQYIDHTYVMLFLNLPNGEFVGPFM